MKIVLFGDSITEGGANAWADQVARRLGDGHDVINKGIGGNNTRDALARIDEDVVALRPDVVAVEFGINDAWQTDSGIFAEEFEENYGEIVSRLMAGGVGRVLLVVNHECVSDEQVSEGMTLFQRNRRNNEIIRRVATREGLEIVDLEALFVGEGLLTEDGVHLSDAGEVRYAEILLGALEGATEK